MTKIMILAAQAILLAGILAAQNPAPQNMMPQNMMRTYDPATETTLKGTVEEVKLVQHGRMMTGTHLMVKTGDETKEVMLGPSNFVTRKGFTFAKGDSIELTGSRISMGDAEYVLAREVVKNGKTLTLRAKNGVPKWAGMKMGGSAPAN